MTTASDVTALERIEAETRIAMAAVTKARGYDSQRVRDDDIAFLDSLLDAWLDLTQDLARR